MQNNRKKVLREYWVLKSGTPAYQHLFTMVIFWIRACILPGACLAQTDPPM
jgi:hypothetical protein